MPRDGSTGQYNLPSGNPFVNGTVIDETVVNATMSDLGTALTNSISKDGQTTVTGNIPMGGFKLTNVAAGSAANQNPVISQIQDGSLITLGSVTGTDTIAGALSPAITSYATRMLVTFTPANNNTGAATIAINGLAAKAVVKGSTGAALVAGDLVSGAPAVILYDGTSFVLLNPVLPSLNASSLTSGTVPDARFPATLPAASGANLTALNAANLSSGTVPDARFPATLPAASGANLTALNAANLSSGTVPDARLYTSGSFTGTLTGCTTSPTVSCRYTRLGALVFLSIDGFNVLGTSNSSAFSMTGLPAAIRPVSNVWSPQFYGLTNNGALTANTNARINAGTDTVDFLLNGDSSGWTASGNKGVGRQFGFAYSII